MNEGIGRFDCFADLLLSIRRDSFGSVPDLIDAIRDYIDAHNEDPQPFIWTAETEKILAKVGRARAALISQQQRETLH